MKRLFLIIMILLLMGCSNDKEGYKKIELYYDSDYYKIAAPYKEAISGNYVVNNVLNNYDINDIEKNFMLLSSNYFKTTNSFYQEGQYLKQEEIKELLENNSLNNFAEVVIKDEKITPLYLNSIYEQNYLSNNNQLKGLTIGLIINSYQAIKGEYGNYNYEEVEIGDWEVALEKGTSEIIDYLKSKKELDKVKIVVGIYFQKDPSSLLPEGIRYVGISDKDKFNLNFVNYEYHYLDSNYVLNNNYNLYNTYLNLDKQIKKVKDSLNVNGFGFYINNNLQSIELTIYGNVFKRGELLYLTEVISGELINFDQKLNLKVFIRSHNNLLGFINKEAGNIKGNVYILGGVK